MNFFQAKMNEAKVECIPAREQRMDKCIEKVVFEEQAKLEEQAHAETLKELKELKELNELEEATRIAKIVEYRTGLVQKASPECIFKGSCVDCGCEIPEKFYEPDACLKGCYPAMKDTVLK